MMSKKIINSFCNLYYASKAFKKNKWLGVPIMQTPSDLLSLQSCVYEAKPKLIIETGTRFGGSALFFASLLDLQKIEGKIITIDVKDNISPLAKESYLWSKYVTFIRGRSDCSNVVEEVVDHSKKYDSIMLFLDSDHHKGTVDRELQLYSSLVTVCNYLIITDTCVNGNPILPKFGPGPMESAIKFLKSHKNFMIDKTKEQNLMTFFPNGFLKRIS